MLRCPLNRQLLVSTQYLTCPKNVKREANNWRFQGLSSEGGYTYLPSGSLKTA